MKTCQRRVERGYLLFDETRVAGIDENWFSPQWWAGQGRLLGGAPGRGTTVFVQDVRGELALRHYRRGGAVGRLVEDRYLWNGLANTRPWREWHLLAKLHDQGLPVPRPVAARCERRGLVYRADLITERLAGATLAEVLARSAPDTSLLQAVGACIRRFHQAGVFHADLNARNILLDARGKVYLLDFDKGEVRRLAEGWQQRNLARLHRSLVKIRAASPGFIFDEGIWREILNGYEGR